LFLQFIESDPTRWADGPAQEWINAVDRGGLTHITTDRNPSCVRRYLGVSKVTEMNEVF